MKKKTVISIILSLVLILGLAPAMSYGEEDAFSSVSDDGTDAMSSSDSEGDENAGDDSKA